MDFGVPVPTAVLDHDTAIIQISRVAKSREDHATCSDPEEHEGINAIRPKNHIEIGASEGAHAMFDDDDFSILWFNCWVNL
jgi:hypothetical protein